MGPIQAVQTCLQKYAVFSGRASRPEFWWFFLFCLLIEIGISTTLDPFLFAIARADNAPMFFPITEMVALLFLLPSLSVTQRRIQDTGRNPRPWMIALGLVIAFGYYWTILDLTAAITDYEDSTLFTVLSIFTAPSILTLIILGALLVICMQRSEPVKNIYGPMPLNNSTRSDGS